MQNTNTAKLAEKKKQKEREVKKQTQWKKKKKGEGKKEYMKKSLYSEDLSVPSIQLIVFGLSSIYFSLPHTKLTFPTHLHPLSLTWHDRSHHAIMFFIPPPSTFFILSLLREKFI